MSGRFVAAHALRETRASLRRIGPYLLSITLGVGALVAIHSLRASIVDGIHAQSRQLLGGDARLASSRPFPPPTRRLLDSLANAGARVAYVTTLPSMVAAPAGGVARLLQLSAVSAAYPLYGTPAAAPAGAWERVRTGEALLAEPGALLQLGARVGDTLRVGGEPLAVAGTVEEAAPGGGFREALGPRLYLSRSALEGTRLLVRGSLARYEALVRAPAGADLAAFGEAHDSLLRAQDVSFQTAEGHARGLSRGLESLSKFLGLIGVMALLLGGIGVGSAIGVYTRERIPTIAVLRCLGATQRQVFLAYVLQAALLGLAGSLAGVVLGLAAQPLLARALRSALPVAVGFHVHPGPTLAGLAVGVWIAIVFALLPLLEVRGVAPLQALRRDFEPVAPTRGARLLALGTLAASVVVLSLWQAPAPAAGFAFAAGIGVTVLLLWALGTLLTRATRRFFPRRARYAVRQGVANLFRPRNQTRAVTLSLGFGVFVIATLLVVQRSLLDKLRLDDAGTRPNLLLFDVLPDQAEGVRDLLAARGIALGPTTPIVPTRIAAVKGRGREAWLADTTDAAPRRWALRREYRDTYRDTLTSTERVVAGRWWDGPRREGETARVSLEEDVAHDLRVGVGDTITWDVTGRMIPSVVANLRSVEWARFEPNFFAVFQSGVLEAAPQMLVALAGVPDDTLRARVQVALVHAYPNVSVLDLDRVQEVLARIAANVTTAVRAVGGLGIVAGLLVLVGAVSTSRQQRLREGALLKAIGADRHHIRQMLFTEYVVLGALSAVTGAGLGIAAGSLLVTRLFEIELHVPIAALVLLALAVAALATAIGLLGGREVLRSTPLAVLRQAE